MKALLTLLLSAAGTKKSVSKVVRRSSATNSGAVSSTTWSVNKPTGAAVGDVVLLCLSLNDGTNAPALPTGFTQLKTVTCTADGAIFTVWGRVIDGTEGSTFGSALTSTGFNNWAADAICYSGVDPTSITDGTASVVVNTATASPITITIPGVTTTVNNDMAVAFFGIDPTTANGTAPAYTAPSGFTAVDAVVSPRQVADVASFEKLISPAAATGNVAAIATASGISAGSMGALIILRAYGIFALSGTLTATGNTSLAYSSTLTLSGMFTGPVTMSTASGTLPAGLSWSVSGNVATLSGTPTTATSYTFTPLATDSLGRTATGPSQTIAVSSGHVGIVQTKFNQTASAASLTITPTTPFTAGNYVIVAVNRYSGTSISSVKINGTTATLLKTVTSGSTNETAIYLGLAGSGSAGCVITLAGSGIIIGSVIERDDINGVDVTAVANTTGTTFTATTATTAQAKETVIAAFCGVNNQNVVITPPSGGGWVTMHNQPNGFSSAPGAASYQDVSTIGTQSATFTTASSLTNAGTAVATIKLL